MWSQLVALAAPGDAVATDEQLRRLAAKLSGVRYIWITRRDKVRQAISLFRAMQTKQWQSWAEPAVREPKYSWEKIDGCIQWALAQDAGWERYFSLLRIQPLRIFYEDFVLDYEATMRSALELLGVPADPIPEARLQRQADALSQEWLERYRNPTLAERILHAAIRLGALLSRLRRPLPPRG